MKDRRNLRDGPLDPIKTNTEWQGKIADPDDSPENADDEREGGLAGF